MEFLSDPTIHKLTKPKNVKNKANKPEEDDFSMNRENCNRVQEIIEKDHVTVMEDWSDLKESFLSKALHISAVDNLLKNGDTGKAISKTFAFWIACSESNTDTFKTMVSIFRRKDYVKLAEELEKKVTYIRGTIKPADYPSGSTSYCPSRQSVSPSPQPHIQPSMAEDGAPTKNPTTVVMVQEAVKTLNEKKGSSAQVITKTVIQKYNLDPDRGGAARVNKALKTAVEASKLVQTKSTGLFKLPKPEKPERKVENSDVKAKKPASAAAANVTSEKTKTPPAKKKPAATAQSKKKIKPVSRTKTKAAVFTSEEDDTDATDYEDDTDSEYSEYSESEEDVKPKPAPKSKKNGACPKSKKPEPAVTSTTSRAKRSPDSATAPAVPLKEKPKKPEPINPKSVKKAKDAAPPTSKGKTR